MAQKNVVTLGNVGILILLMGQMLPLIDFSIINVALENISANLHTSNTELLLIICIYGVAFASFLAISGKLGDMFGRVRLFRVGIVLFGLSSFACAIAMSASQLVVARLFQGFSAALFVPQILATIHTQLKGEKLTKTLSLYAGMGGISFLIGQILGGYLVDWNIFNLEWRSLFFINVPVCLVIALVADRYIPQIDTHHQVKIDLLGGLILLALLSSLLFASAFGPELHWPVWCFVLIVLSVVLFFILLKHSQRLLRQQKSPLFPIQLFSFSSMMFGKNIGLIFFACWSGFMFYIALYFQKGLNMSPSESGRMLTSLGIVFFLAALVAPHIIKRFELKKIYVTANIAQLIGLSLLIFTLHYVDQLNPYNITIAFSVMAFAQAMIVNSYYRIGMQNMDAANSGSASALLGTIQQSALGLGPAILGLFFNYRFHTGHGYLDSTTAVLIAQGVLMLILLLSAIRYFKNN